MAKKPCLWVQNIAFSFFVIHLIVLPKHIKYLAGLVSYCVPSGEAHEKALHIARDINQKVWSRHFHLVYFILHVFLDA